MEEHKTFIYSSVINMLKKLSFGNQQKNVKKWLIINKTLFCVFLLVFTQMSLP